MNSVGRKFGGGGGGGGSGVGSSNDHSVGGWIDRGSWMRREE